MENDLYRRVWGVEPPAIDINPVLEAEEESPTPRDASVEHTHVTSGIDEVLVAGLGLELRRALKGLGDEVLELGKHVSRIQTDQAGRHETIELLPALDTEMRIMNKSLNERLEGLEAIVRRKSSSPLEFVELMQNMTEMRQRLEDVVAQMAQSRLDLEQQLSLRLDGALAGIQEALRGIEKRISAQVAQIQSDLGARIRSEIQELKRPDDRLEARLLQTEGRLDAAAATRIDELEKRLDEILRPRQPKRRLRKEGRDPVAWLDERLRGLERQIEKLSVQVNQISEQNRPGSS